MSAKSLVTSVALAVAAACAVSGCSSSSKTPAATGAGATQATGGGAGTGAAASGGQAGGGGAPASGAQAGGGQAGGGQAGGGLAALGGSALDVSKQCKAIKPADAQALMKAPLGPVVINPLECDYAGGTMQVNIRLDDAAHAQYTLLATPDPAHAVSGVGDQAFWFEPVPGHTTPQLESYKGSIACDVAPADPQDTTLVYTGNPPIVTVADSDAVAYVQKEAALCKDVFAAG